MCNPPDETRKVREQNTRRAVADEVRLRLFFRRQQQLNLSMRTGISRSHIRAILRADKSVSLFLFLELSGGLGIKDPCELLRAILNRLHITTRVS
jgi:hypothetical protein